jgi:hypothetical protein
MQASTSTTAPEQAAAQHLVDLGHRRIDIVIAKESDPFTSCPTRLPPPITS